MSSGDFRIRSERFPDVFLEDCGEECEPEYLRPSDAFSTLISGETPTPFVIVPGMVTMQTLLGGNEGGSWGVGGAATKAAGLRDLDGDTTYVQSGMTSTLDMFCQMTPLGFVPSYALVRAFARLALPANDFVEDVQLWCSHDIQPTFGGGGGNGFNHNPFIVGPSLPHSATYIEFQYQMSGADIVALADGGGLWGAIYCGFRQPGNFSNTSPVNVTQIIIEVFR